jgi:multidrug resistance efflux pump
MSEDRNAHPDEQRFSLYVLDALDAEEVAAFEGHIRACSACEHKLAMEAELEVALLAAAHELTHVPLASRAPRASKSATLVGAALVAAAAAVVLVARLGDRPTTAPKAGAAMPAASAASVNVVMPMAGTIASIEARVGSRVRRGQIVAKLDDSAAQADLAAGNVELRVAEDALKQKGLLFKAQVVTDVDSKQAEAAVAVVRSKLFAMVARVEQTKLRAPADGTVIEILAHPGNTLAWGAPVMRLSEDKRATPSKVVSDVDVDERCRVASVEVGPGTEVKREQLVLRCRASAERERANADLASAEHDFKRTVQLRELGEVTDREFRQAQGAIAAARALVSRQPREQLEIRAPIDGTVLEVFARRRDLGAACDRHAAPCVVGRALHHRGWRHRVAFRKGPRARAHDGRGRRLREPAPRACSGGRSAAHDRQRALPRARGPGRLGGLGRPGRAHGKGKGQARCSRRCSRVGNCRYDAVQAPIALKFPRQCDVLGCHARTPGVRFSLSPRLVVLCRDAACEDGGHGALDAAARRERAGAACARGEGRSGHAQARGELCDRGAVQGGRRSAEREVGRALSARL